MRRIGRGNSALRLSIALLIGALALLGMLLRAAITTVLPLLLNFLG